LRAREDAVKSKEVEVQGREDNVKEEVDGIKKKYSKKLSKQESEIKDQLHKQGYVLFEHGGGGLPWNTC
jgi:hypothetical protein